MSIKAMYLIFTMMLTLLVTSSVRAQEALISDLVVTNNRMDLLGFFKIKDAFSPELRNGLQHGIPVTFTFEFVLKMIRDSWVDQEIYSGSFEHTMTYDSLKKEYTVIKPKDGGKRLVTNDLNDATEFMSEINSMNVCPLAKLRHDRLYTLKVKATLAKTTLPLNFHYLIPFTEFWDLQTDWKEAVFSY